MSEFIKSLQALPEFCSLNGASEEAVSQAELDLKVRFCPEYREYVRAFGVISANGHELTGVCKSVRLNVVAVTTTERANNPRVPGNWYVVEQANIDDIMIWQNEFGEVFQTSPNCSGMKIADSLLEYIS